MTTENPLRTGVAVSLTIVIAYTVCAALFAMWPERGVDFLNALFHGLDFHKLEPSIPFTFQMFLYPLVVFLIWGFVVGALFGWFHNLVHGSGDGRTR